MIGPRRSIIGVDAGQRIIAVAQVSAPARRQSGGAARPRLEAAACIPRTRAGGSKTLTPEEARGLIDLLARQGFAGREVAVAVPTARLLTAVLDLPPQSSGAPLDSIAKAEIARTHRVDADAIESAWWPLPAPQRSGEGQAAFAVACAHADAEAVLSPLADSAGARAVTLEGRASALARAWSARVAGSGRICALLDLAWENALLAVTCEGTLVYERVLEESGLARLHARLASDLGVEPEIADHLLFNRGLPAAGSAAEPGEDDLLGRASQCILDHLTHAASEVTLSISYAARRYSPASSSGDLLLMSGEGASIPGAVAALGRHAGAQAEAFDAASLMAVSGRAAVAASNPALAVAVGLSLWQPAVVAQDPAQRRDAA